MVWQGDGVEMERVGGIKSYLGGEEMRVMTLKGPSLWSGAKTLELGMCEQQQGWEGR